MTASDFSYLDFRTSKIAYCVQGNTKWFSLNDIVAALHYKSIDSIRQYLTSASLRTATVHVGDNVKTIRFVRDTELYQHLHRAKKPLAKEFLATVEENPRQVSVTTEDTMSATDPVTSSMGEIKIFENPAFGSIRTVQRDGEPWFVGKDVAEVLGYRDTSDALKKHVDDDDKLTRRFTDSGQSREMYIINESGLYSLILSSKLPTAKKFKRWVTGEVLPSIRKHGAYMTPEKLGEALLNPDVMIQIMTNLKAEQEKNRALTVENQLLSEEASTWADRTVLTALIKSYSSRLHGIRNVFYGYDDFFKELANKTGIDLRHRKDEAGERFQKKSFVSFLKDDELSKALCVAANMCREIGVDIVRAINPVNARRVDSYCRNV